MNFKLETNIEKSSLNLNHKDKILLIGSCFSNKMSFNLTNRGFSFFENPFGILFHPLAISNVINNSITNEKSVDIYKNDDLFYSWDSSGAIFDFSKEKLIKKIVKIRQDFRQRLISSNFLIITFGSAWGFTHNDILKVVGNCHKEKQDKFTKSLTSISLMEDVWSDIIRRIRNINSDLKIIFTVSPVRHQKDGLIDNNRSKSRLIELVHNLVSFNNVEYFPAYEILIDELRDYRFYSDDLVHPSNFSLKFIWEKFEQVYCSKDTVFLSNEIMKIKRTDNHKSIHPNSNSDIRMKEINTSLKNKLIKKYPYLKI